MSQSEVEPCSCKRICRAAKCSCCGKNIKCFTGCSCACAKEENPNVPISSKDKKRPRTFKVKAPPKKKRKKQVSKKKPTKVTENATTSENTELPANQIDHSQEEDSSTQTNEKEQSNDTTEESEMIVDIEDSKEEKNQTNSSIPSPSSSNIIENNIEEDTELDCDITLTEENSEKEGNLNLQSQNRISPINNGIQDNNSSSFDDLESKKINNEDNKEEKTNNNLSEEKNNKINDKNQETDVNQSEYSELSIELENTEGETEMSISLDISLDESENNKESEKINGNNNLQKDMIKKSKNRRVSFDNTTKVRLYKRTISVCSVPSLGSYPLGLSWEIKGETEFPLSEGSENQGTYPYQVPLMTENDRITALQSAGLHVNKPLLGRGNRSTRGRGAVLTPDSLESTDEDDQKITLDHIRNSRNMVGCHCTPNKKKKKKKNGKKKKDPDFKLPNCCSGKTCSCALNGLRCHIGSCFCADYLCKNPHGRRQLHVAEVNLQRLRVLNPDAYNSMRRNNNNDNHDSDIDSSALTNEDIIYKADELDDEDDILQGKPEKQKSKKNEKPEKKKLQKKKDKLEKPKKPEKQEKIIENNKQKPKKVEKPKTTVNSRISFFVDKDLLVAPRPDPQSNFSEWLRWSKNKWNSSIVAKKSVSESAAE